MIKIKYKKLTDGMYFARTDDVNKKSNKKIGDRHYMTQWQRSENITPETFVFVTGKEVAKLQLAVE